MDRKAPPPDRAGGLDENISPAESAVRKRPICLHSFLYFLEGESHEAE